MSSLMKYGHGSPSTSKTFKRKYRGNIKLLTISSGNTKVVVSNRAPERKEYVHTKHFTQSHLNQQENVTQTVMSKMRCNSTRPGGVIFHVSVLQKKLI